MPPDSSSTCSPESATRRCVVMARSPRLPAGSGSRTGRHGGCGRDPPMRAPRRSTVDVQDRSRAVHRSQHVSFAQRISAAPGELAGTVNGHHAGGITNNAHKLVFVSRLPAGDARSLWFCAALPCLVLCAFSLVPSRLAVAASPPAAPIVSAATETPAALREYILGEANAATRFSLSLAGPTGIPARTRQSRIAMSPHRPCRTLRPWLPPRRIPPGPLQGRAAGPLPLPAAWGVPSSISSSVCGVAGATASIAGASAVTGLSTVAAAGSVS